MTSDESGRTLDQELRDLRSQLNIGGMLPARIDVQPDDVQARTLRSLY